MRTCWALAVAMGSLATAARAEDLLKLEYGPYHSGIGGEFMVTPVSGNSPGLVGMPADVSLATLQTFCMQSDELIAAGETYRFVINTGTISKGNIFDPIDPRTAYLYTYFRNGTLPGYDYGAGRVTSAGHLQDAVWFIENQVFGVHNSFVDLADAAVGPGGVWEGKGIGSVRVLNLFDAERNDIQDQLTMVPAPGAAGLAMTAGVWAMRRRR